MRESPCMTGACTQAGGPYRVGTSRSVINLWAPLRRTCMIRGLPQEGRPTMEHGEAVFVAFYCPAPATASSPPYGRSCATASQLDPLAAAPRSWLLQAGGM